MDIGQDIQNVYEGVVNLNPFIVFIVSFIGLALTLFFIVGFILLYRTSKLEKHATV